MYLRAPHAPTLQCATSGTYAYTSLQLVGPSGPSTGTLPWPDPSVRSGLNPSQHIVVRTVLKHHHRRFTATSNELQQPRRHKPVDGGQEVKESCTAGRPSASCGKAPRMRFTRSVITKPHDVTLKFRATCSITWTCKSHVGGFLQHVIQLARWHWTLMQVQKQLYLLWYR